MTTLKRTKADSKLLNQYADKTKLKYHASICYYIGHFILLHF